MDTSPEKNRSGEFKEFTIIVNAREKQWFQDKISYEQIVVLAFGFVENNTSILYSVIYKKGDNSKPEGVMVEGDEMEVKNDMRFNVTQTSRS